MLDFYTWLIVQIVLESFPVSSSGHVSLVEQYLHRFGYQMIRPASIYIDFLHVDMIAINVLEHLVHGVTVVILLLFFYKRWVFLLVHIRRCWPIVLKIIGYTFVADCITASWFVFFQHHVRASFPLGFGFIITAAALYSLRWCQMTKRASYNVRIALLLGGVQGIALLPGISRFAITYVAARWLLLPSHKAFEISFLLQWPLILAAFLHSLWAVAGQVNNYFFMQFHILVVVACIGVIAFWALKLSAYLHITNRLWLFSLYMIIPIIGWLLLFV